MPIYACFMMMSSYGNICRVTGPLWGEFSGHRWLPMTKASNGELWCFLWSAPWINGWVYNCEAGDLRRHLAQYDVIVMWWNGCMMQFTKLTKFAQFADTWVSIINISHSTFRHRFDYISKTVPYINLIKMQIIRGLFSHSDWWILCSWV